MYMCWVIHMHGYVHTMTYVWRSGGSFQEMNSFMLYVVGVEIRLLVLAENH